MTSRKIAGTRRRQLPSGAEAKTEFRTPDSSRISTPIATNVPTMRTGVECAGIPVAPTIAASSAPSGTRTLRSRLIGPTRGLPRRRRLCCHSVSAMSSRGNPTATPTAQ